MLVPGQRSFCSVLLDGVALEWRVRFGAGMLVRLQGSAAVLLLEWRVDFGSGGLVPLQGLQIDILGRCWSGVHRCRG